MHSFAVEVLNFRYLAIQFNITNTLVKNKLQDLLVEGKGVKFQITFKLTCHEEIENVETKYWLPICFSSKTTTGSNDLDIFNGLNTSFLTILSRTEKWLVKVLVR